MQPRSERRPQERNYPYQRERSDEYEGFENETPRSTYAGSRSSARNEDESFRPYDSGRYRDASPANSAYDRATYGSYFGPDAARAGSFGANTNRDSEMNYGSDRFDYEKYSRAHFYGYGTDVNRFTSEGRRHVEDRGSAGYAGEFHEENPSAKQRRPDFTGKGPKNFVRSDEKIRDEVCEMLTRHHEVDAHDIEVQVQAGEVTLEGHVPNRRMKHLAEDAAALCDGVKDVVNHLHVDQDSLIRNVRDISLHQP
ncbi:MAG TPA: BON domain-containing protein [Bdellovibrio sp.]|uniref:BON domain-containing protein n=1 Tax=Bdellovibrio sp. TaxID=28201 RepID=UPI002F0C92BA